MAAEIPTYEQLNEKQSYVQRYIGVALPEAERQLVLTALEELIDGLAARVEHDTQEQPR